MVAFKGFFSRISLDVIGFSASALCAIHCLAMPVIILAGTLHPAGVAHSHGAENMILLISALLGSFSIVPSWLRHHRRALPVVIFLCGLALIAISRFQVAVIVETMMTSSGAVLVAFSHYLNWRFCRAIHTTAERK